MNCIHAYVHVQLCADSSVLQQHGTTAFSCFALSSHLQIAGLGDKTAVTMTRRQVRSGDKKQVSSAAATTATVDSSSSHAAGPDDMRISDDEGDQDDDLPVASAAAIEISKQPSSDAAAEAAAVWWGRPMHEWSRDVSNFLETYHLRMRKGGCHVCV